MLLGGQNIPKLQNNQKLMFKKNKKEVEINISKNQVQFKLGGKKNKRRKY